MEAILGSGNNERLITEDLVGLGLRGIYGGAMDLFARRLGNPADGSDGATQDTAGEAANAGDGAAAAVSEDDVTIELEIQANIYKMCVQRDGERRVLNELLRRKAGDTAKLKARLEELDRYEVGYTPHSVQSSFLLKCMLCQCRP